MYRVLGLSIGPTRKRSYNYKLYILTVVDANLGGARGADPRSNWRGGQCPLDIFFVQYVPRMKQFARTLPPPPPVKIVRIIRPRYT